MLGSDSFILDLLSTPQSLSHERPKFAAYKERCWGQCAATGMGKQASMVQSVGTEQGPSWWVSQPWWYSQATARQQPDSSHSDSNTAASCIPLDSCFAFVLAWSDRHFSSMTVVPLEGGGRLPSPNSLLVVGSWGAPLVKHLVMVIH